MVSCTQQSCNFRYNQVHTYMNNLCTMYINIMCMHVHVYDMYVHVCVMYVLYLWTHSMKAVFSHIKWITSCTHDAIAPPQF